MIVAVTAYVPIPGHPRSEEEYRRLALPLHTLSFDAPILSRDAKLEDCWLLDHLNGLDHPVTHSVADNPKKNTMAYHIVQAQKTQFLVEAAKACSYNPDVYVWIDYGIFHVPGVTAEIIREFLARADGEEVISVPGCWGPNYVYDDLNPCWRFCGGVMVVPRKYLHVLDKAMKQEYTSWIARHHHVSWEVNTLARLERREPDLPIWWYQADHDETLFTNYRSTVHADVTKEQAFVRRFQTRPR